ncbi:formylglycine-generating enzyme family protein [Micrococcus sp. ACRRV]|nr:formylglycine-generating enzyme family protein [Micrococcus sp. ACRRV]
MLEHTSSPDCVQGAIDDDMMLTGAVDEWRFIVQTLADRLDQAAHAAGTPVSTAADVDAGTPAGTVSSDHQAGPDMVVIPAGTCTAGSTDAEHEAWGVPENRRDFELPQREVTIAEPFALGRTEVTVEQFQAFVDDTGYQVCGGSRWWDPEDPSAMTFNPELSYLDPGFEQTPDSPSVALTRQDAQAYVDWLSETTGESDRLPTEDEWEWAARGGADTAFFWGDTLDEAARYANTYDTVSQAVNGFPWESLSVTDRFAHTAPVGSFEADGFGLYDVTGNARAFMADDWIEDLSGTAGDGSVHDGPVPFPVVRGGAWNYQPQNLRLDYRGAYLSAEVATTMFGFRVVRDLG